MSKGHACYSVLPDAPAFLSESTELISIFERVWLVAINAMEDAVADFYAQVAKPSESLPLCFVR